MRNAHAFYRGATAVLAVAALAACGGGSSAPAGSPASTTAGSTVGGTLTITGERGMFATGDSCVGDGGYDDIRGGATVRVATDDGKTLALGELQPGRVQTSDTRPKACVFAFVISDVDLGEGRFFGVEVAQRGEVKVPREQLEGTSLSLTLG